jgi:serine protease AprX
MKKLFTLCAGISLLACSSVHAQSSRHIVKFKDKNGTPFTLANPQAYLTQKSIARRVKQSIAIDSTDLPITPRYLDSIRSVPNVTILNTSKWLNQVLIQTTNAAAMAKIQGFPFVAQLAPIGARLGPVQPESEISATKLKVTINGTGNQRTTQTEQTNIDYGNATAQIKMHNGDFLHNWGFRGENITMAMMDAGFFGYLTNTGIDSIRINNQVKGTWDFVANNDQVSEDHPHGFYCLSIIAANKPGQMVGTAPKADFYLYRTEDAATEYPVEEQNWVAAAERADSLGADIFSTSLGYLTFDNPAFNYSYAARNGNTAIMTIGGDLAAKKGIIVCNSAGNNGGTATDGKFVAVPADGDSVIAVGACNASQVIANFSAWGPNSAGAIKPNITSVGVGTSFISVGGTPTNGNGTSFSCPNIAGLITCLLQAFYESGNMEITNAVQQSADKFSAPDARFGYGIPDMKKAFVIMLKRKYNTVSVLNANCTAELQFNIKGSAAMQFELERKGPGDNNFFIIKRFNVNSADFRFNTVAIRDTLNYQTGGGVSYRLKHIIGTDTSFYYDTQVLNLVQPCGNNKIIISPNPVKDNLKIVIGATLNLSNPLVRITAGDGKVIYKSAIGSGSNNINARGWAAGVYVIEIISNKEVVAIKRVVKE